MTYSKEDQQDLEILAILYKDAYGYKPRDERFIMNFLSLNSDDRHLFLKNLEETALIKVMEENSREATAAFAFFTNIESEMKVADLTAKEVILMWTSKENNCLEEEVHVQDIEQFIFNKGMSISMLDSISKLYI